MIKIAIEVIDQIKAKNNGTFPLMDSNDIKGGYYQVETIRERDDIPRERLKIGMLCYVLEDGEIYKLNENNAWVVFSTGTGDGVKRGSISSSFPTSTTVGKKDMVTIPYVFNTENIGTAKLYVTVVCGEKVKELEYDIKRIGAGSVNIGILDRGANTVTMYVVDAMNKMTNVLTFEIMCGVLEIHSTFDGTQDFNKYSPITIPINVEPIDDSEMTLVVNVGGEEYTSKASAGYNSFIFPENKKTVGIHPVTIKVITDKYISNILEYNIAIVSNTEILLSTPSTSVTFEEGVKFEIPYRISINGVTSFNAKIYVDSNLKKEQRVEIGSNKFTPDLIDFIKGEHTVQIVITSEDGTMSSTLTITVNITESSFERITHVPAGLEAFFNMASKSNNDEDKDVLVSSVLNSNGKFHTLTLHDYNYNTNGWVDGKLVSNGTAWAEIDMKPLEDNVLQGFTFDILFKSTNMGDDENRVIDCTYGGIPSVGFKIDSTKSVITTENNSLENHFTNNEFTRVTFVVNRSSTFLDKWLTDENGNLIPNPNPERKPNPMIQTYINGILTEAALLSDSGTGSNKIYENIKHDGTILINTDSTKKLFGVSEIKTIAIYNRPLDHEEVLRNLMADIDDLMEQKEKYERNYVTINQDIPTIYFNDTDIGKHDDMTKDNKQFINIVYNSPDKEKFGPSFDLIGETAWQGTSSLGYPIKNYKFKLYDYSRDENGEPISTTDKKTFVKQYLDMYGARDGNGYPENVFCLKADYMDSSHCRNTGTARMVNDFLFEGHPNPAKQLDPKTRDTINGFPVQLYVNGEWIGIYNFNHDKSCFKSLGMSTIKHTVRWEVKANTTTSAGAFYKTWEEGNIDDIYEKILADFEIVFDEDAFEENSGNYDLTKYYDELKIPYVHTPIGGYKDYSILSIARLVQFVSETTDMETYKEKAPKYFDIKQACRYYLNTMTLGMIDNFAKNCIINMYGDDVWWFSFYDLDSSLGLDNTGYSKFESDIEPTQPNVYNCSNSKMWVKLNDFFKDELFNEFNTLRNSTYTYENICSYLIGLQINEIPEIAYNKDMYEKYISQGRRYLHMLHGNNKDHILRWLYNRFLYVDSLFLQHNSPYTKSNITIRSTKPLSGPALENLPDGVHYRPRFEIETYVPQYVTIAWRKNTYMTKRVGWGEKVVFEYDMTNPTDNELIVYCASNLKRLGDCSDKNPTSIDIGNAYKLVDFRCENGNVLVKADLSKNSFLKEVSFKNCSMLGDETGGAGASVLDVSLCTNLRKLDIRGTKITAVNTNVNGGNLNEIYYPSTIQSVVVKNQTNLKVLGLPAEAPTGLVTVDIKNCKGIEKFNVNNNSTSSFKNARYLSLDEITGITSLSLGSFRNLTEVDIKNMPDLNYLSFGNLVSISDEGILKKAIISNNPKLTSLDMTCSGSYLVKFAENSTLDLRNQPALKKIESNYPIVGLNNIYLPLSINELIFELDSYESTTPSIKNIWSSNCVDRNISSGFTGVDLDGITLNSFNISSLNNIKEFRNLKIDLTGVLEKGYYFEEKPKISGTIDLSNYKGSCESLFRGYDISNITFKKTNEFSQSNFRYMFSGSIIGNCDVSGLLNKMTNVSNLCEMFSYTDIQRPLLPVGINNTSIITADYMFYGCKSIVNLSGFNLDIGINSTACGIFQNCDNLETATDIMINAQDCSFAFAYCKKLIYPREITFGDSVRKLKKAFYSCTSLTHDILFGPKLTNVEQAFEDCTNLVYAHSNWKNVYNGNITSTDCYKGCEKIGYVDGEVWYDGVSGLPVAWGGSGFSSEDSDMFLIDLELLGTATIDVKSGGSFMTEGTIDWGDGTVDTNTVHTYSKLGQYTIRAKAFLYPDDSYTTSSTCSTHIKTALVEVLRIRSNVQNLTGGFQGCKNLKKANLSNIKNLTKLAYTFCNCPNLESVNFTNVKTTNLISMERAFQSCSKLKELTNIENLDFSYTYIFDTTFSGCTSFRPSVNFAKKVLEAGKTNSYKLDCDYAFKGIKFSDASTIDLDVYNANRSVYLSGCFQSTNLVRVKRMAFSNIESFDSTFESCSNLVSVNDISCKSSSTTKFSAASSFRHCVALQSITNWRVYNNINTYIGMFYSSSSFANLKKIERLSINGLTSYSSFCSDSYVSDFANTDITFEGPIDNEQAVLCFCTNNNTNKIGFVSQYFNVFTLTALISALADNTGNTAKTLPLGTVALSKLTAEQIAVATNKNWTVV